MSFDTVDLITGNNFQVTWDLGRRCNYDCSYCPAHRHDNFSPHATLEELKANTSFLFEYIDTYMQYRDLKNASISFTGGEPTVNPHFIPFIKYLKDDFEKTYSKRWSAQFSLTTNGAMSKKMGTAVMENFRHATVSYHSESSQKLKDQVRDRIIQFHNEGPENDFDVSVNVMFHAAHFNECKELCDFLHEKGIKYVPRVIGEEKTSSSAFAHQYTEEQLDYMKNYWKYKNATLNGEKEVSHKLSAVGEPTNEVTKVAEAVPVLTPKKDGYAIGRPCCGSREMCLSANGEERKSTFVDFRNFKGWHCSVNWFFLHLEQQTDSVFHHQTCQAKFDQTRGPIGKISEGDKIIAELKERLETKTMPTVICPKHTCGCGLCAPKSAYKENFKDVLYNHVDSSVFENSMKEVPNAAPIIPTVAK
jgi:sulfatase maturation enzyme AslB (radical SAM superfamily)